MHASCYLIDFEGNLWSFGYNDYGQLGHGDTTSINTPKIVNTLKDIQQISYGSCGVHFIAKNSQNQIFVNGYNDYGQLGTGDTSNDSQITPSLILNLPSNIVQFVCGSCQSLFLDSEGNVFSVGYNEHGELGLGHNIHKNELNKIPNIPPIKIISCVSSSSYLIDFEGNLWTFGYNGFGQLGQGDTIHKYAPKIINTLKDIQQISSTDVVGSILLRKTLKIKYLLLGITITDNLEQEILNQFQFSKK